MALILGLGTVEIVAVVGLVCVVCLICLVWFALSERADSRMWSKARQELAADSLETVLARIDAELDAIDGKFTSWRGTGIEHVSVGWQGERLDRRRRHLVRYREIVIKQRAVMCRQQAPD
jgi:hypothetical protein